MSFWRANLSPVASHKQRCGRQPSSLHHLIFGSVNFLSLDGT